MPIFPICARCGSCTVSAPGDICPDCLDALSKEARSSAVFAPLERRRDTIHDQQPHTFPKCAVCKNPLPLGAGNLCVYCGPIGSGPVAGKTQRNLGLDEGQKFDGAKLRYELIPPEAVDAMARVLTYGAAKYADRNWEKGMKWGRVFGAAMRHLWAWWGGAGQTRQNFAFGEIDPETGLSHLWHALCCVAFLVAYEARKIGEDDRK